MNGGGKKLLFKARVKLMLNDLSIIHGILLGFDKHMNVIIWGGDELIKEHKKSLYWQTRSIGLCVVRGDMIVSISLDVKRFLTEKI
ncbi:small nuclear ribonucleoprotein-associated protein B (nucleomorph) [Chroomonas mesostigmatica CCMP1168]|uniref:Small nuclear ribonucleoprotein-associated protein B n=1 Tax=Chroomonas mesostigmatica CCMP1168 TaxID=1195612 RepID=J7G1D4_9CRYP|nr:small nuclear ribonucleoprotein-associated protein B [Chroomonas mesostigmatica CCMP1168]|mmetsp:Transcript_60053/g.147665  ORF Transcript_60053/g.147665 Transcript_60053/m.147665 type:complete len:86 (+) Transcript_60053:73-330(+)